MYESGFGEPSFRFQLLFISLWERWNQELEDVEKSINGAAMKNMNAVCHWRGEQREELPANKVNCLRSDRVNEAYRRVMEGDVMPSVFLPSKETCFGVEYTQWPHPRDATSWRILRQRPLNPEAALSDWAAPWTSCKASGQEISRILWSWDRSISAMWSKSQKWSISRGSMALFASSNHLHTVAWKNKCGRRETSDAEFTTGVRSVRHELIRQQWPPRQKAVW